MLKHVKFVELPVVDLDRAIRFYTERLGLRLVQDRAYSGDWRWVELEVNGAATRILLVRREGEPRAGVPSLILVADDVHATCEALADKGLRFIQPPQAAPWSPDEIFALLDDGEGNSIMIGSS